MKKVVAVSLRVLCSADYGEDRDAVSHDWIRYFDKINLMPVLIPNIITDPVELIEKTKVQAILLTGGGDVNINNNNELEGKRDLTERKLIEWAIDNNCPIIGVCRGMQALNVFFGGSIEYNIEKTYSEKHVSCTHSIFISDNKISSRIGEEFVTNSFHDNGVTEKSLAKVLQPFAFSKKGLVEGFFHRKLNICGISWHPERQNSSEILDEYLINNSLNRI